MVRFILFSYIYTIFREIVIYENIRLVCLLGSTADFGVKTNANLQLRQRAKIDLRLDIKHM